MEKFTAAEVSFRLAGGKNPLIFAPTFVNGKGPYQFILDTGAGISLLSPDLARNLEVYAPESRVGTGIGGKVNMSVGNIESLAIGQARLENVQIAITSEIRRIGTVVGEQIDGGIGYNYLKNFRLTIDYPKNILQLAYENQKNGFENSQHTGLRFRLADPAKPLILIPVFVNGRGPYPFALDTGASITVLSAKLAQSLGLNHDSVCDSTGAGGVVRTTVVEVSSLAVGTARLYNLSAAVTDALSQISQVVKTELEGIIGYNFLKVFTVTIDYPNSILRFE